MGYYPGVTPLMVAPWRWPSQFWTVCLEKNRPSLQIVCQTCPFTSVPDAPGFQWWKNHKKNLWMVLCFMFFHPGYNFKPNWRHDCQADFAEERCTRKILDGSHWASKLLETCQLCLYTTVTLKSWSQSLREKGPLRPFWFILLDAPLASKIGTWDRSFYKASVLLQFRQCSEVCPKHASEQFDMHWTAVATFVPFGPACIVSPHWGDRCLLGLLPVQVYTSLYMV